MRVLRAGFALAFLLGLVGCQGGGSTTPTTPTTPGPVSTATPVGQAHSLGANISPLSARAKVAAAIAPFSGATLPSSVDLSAQFPPPGDQGQESSCVGWAIAYALKGYQVHVQLQTPFDTSHLFSAAFIYNQINHGVDQGSSMTDALSLLQTEGAAPVIDMPYIPGDYLSQPSSAARSDAARYHIDLWNQIDPGDLQTIKAHLNAGLPVVIAALVDQSFEFLGRGQVWSSSGPPLGGHALAVVGYDDARHAFKLINSWGTGWSDGGFGWIDYSLFPQVVKEAYVTKDSTYGPGPGPVSPPTPAPVSQYAFNITNVQYNLFNPTYGPGMEFDGTLGIPRGTSGSLQIVVQIYANGGSVTAPAKGQPVPGFLPFATVQGVAATGTSLLPIPAAGIQTPWFAGLPYYAMNLPRGVPINLVAEPVLYINQYGVARGQLIPFVVVL